MDYELRFSKLPQSPKSQGDRLTPVSMKQSPRLNQNNFNNSPILQVNLFSKNSEKLYSKGYDLELQPMMSSIHPSPHNKSPINRKISQKPLSTIPFEMTLSDFYSHPMDWSTKDIIAVSKSPFINLVTLKTQQIFKVKFEVEVEAMKFSKDGSSLFCGCECGVVYQYDPIRNDMIKRLDYDTDRVSCIDTSERYELFAFNNGFFGLHDRRTDRPSTTFLRGHYEACITVLINQKDDNYIASSGTENSVKIWDVRNMKRCVVSYEQHNSAVRAISWSPNDHDIIATGGGISDQKLNLWNVISGETVRSCTTGTQICDIYWNKEYKEILVTEGYASNGISVYNDTNMHKVASVSGHHERVLYSALSPTCERLATLTPKDPIQIWNIFPKKRAVINIR
ncbi:Meiotic fizzy-related protein 1 [Tritrichomonas foetus]|uniref:Meiotic fizzy-related protein 1 n=1 Tax=Tritrichomonas foetus TaxID=1144522 RepID=A0A1J4JKS5_9EUKA|nr:Meiotic fizzy-related protein 1 [Tritrichomonas foetus]|eukprot:OHS97860.1 Meiotic fizzy-related protein 1 [Tritrichomonas foetus]